MSQDVNARYKHIRSSGKNTLSERTYIHFLRQSSSITGSKDVAFEFNLALVVCTP